MVPMASAHAHGHDVLIYVCRSVRRSYHTSHRQEKAIGVHHQSSPVHQVLCHACLSFLHLFLFKRQICSQKKLEMKATFLLNLFVIMYPIQYQLLFTRHLRISPLLLIHQPSLLRVRPLSQPISIFQDTLMKTTIIVK